jgi:hypothetical protein
VLAAAGRIELVQHEPGEDVPAGGRADEVEFFGLPGGAVGGRHDPVEHHRIHDVCAGQRVDLATRLDIPEVPFGRDHFSGRQPVHHHELAGFWPVGDLVAVREVRRIRPDAPYERGGLASAV